MHNIKKTQRDGDDEGADRNHRATRAALALARWRKGFAAGCREAEDDEENAQRKRSREYGAAEGGGCASFQLGRRIILIYFIAFEEASRRTRRCTPWAVFFFKPFPSNNVGYNAWGAFRSVPFFRPITTYVRPVEGAVVHRTGYRTGTCPPYLSARIQTAKKRQRGQSALAEPRNGWWKGLSEGVGLMQGLEILNR